MDSEAHETLSVLFFAVLLRALSGANQALLARDSVLYLEQAEALQAGQWTQALLGYYPPLYPLLTALLGFILPLEWAALSVSVAASALATVLVYQLSLRAFDSPDGALLSALAVAVSPFFVQSGGQLLADSVYGLLFLSVLWDCDAGEWTTPRAARVGLWAGLAALCRPEGLVLLLTAVLLAACSRLRSALLLAFVGFALLAPYSVFLRVQTGQWHWTRKTGVVMGAMARHAEDRGGLKTAHQHFLKEESAAKQGRDLATGGGALWRVLAERPLLTGSKMIGGLRDIFWRLPKLLFGPFFVLAFMGLAVLVRDQGWRFWPGLPLIGTQVLVVSLVTVQTRYLWPCGALMAMALTPLWLDCESRGWGRRLRLVFGLFLVLSCAVALKPSRYSRLYVKTLAMAVSEDMERRFAGQEGRLLVLDRRVHYYARRTSPRLGRVDWSLFHSHEQWRRFCKRQGVTHVVLRRAWMRDRQPWFEGEPGPEWDLLIEIDLGGEGFRLYGRR